VNRGRYLESTTWAGVDVREWADAIIALPWWEDWQREVMRRYTVRVRAFDRPPRDLGFVRVRTRTVSVSVWPGRRGCGMVETLLHELTHVAGYVEHDIAFRRGVLGACGDLTGISLGVDRDPYEETAHMQAVLLERWPHLSATEVARMPAVPFVPYTPLPGEDMVNRYARRYLRRLPQYEWVAETFVHGDLRGHRPTPSMVAAGDVWADQPDDGPSTRRVVLVRRLFGQQGEIHRSYVYPHRVEGMPRRFPSGHPVPERYRRETLEFLAG